jgi:hypothetical protein
MTSTPDTITPIPAQNPDPTGSRNDTPTQATNSAWRSIIFGTPPHLVLDGVTYTKIYDDMKITSKDPNSIYTISRDGAGYIGVLSANNQLLSEKWTIYGEFLNGAKFPTNVIFYQPYTSRFLYHEAKPNNVKKVQYMSGWPGAYTTDKLSALCVWGTGPKYNNYTSIGDYTLLTAYGVYGCLNIEGAGPYRPNNPMIIYKYDKHLKHQPDNQMWAMERTLYDVKDPATKISTQVDVMPDNWPLINN